jgi:hypothetical protein
MTYRFQDSQNLAQSQGKEQIEKLFEQYSLLFERSCAMLNLPSTGYDLAEQSQAFFYTLQSCQSSTVCGSINFNIQPL